MVDLKKITGGLFDFTFSTFITTKIVKVCYVLGMIGIGISTVAIIASSFAQSTLGGVVALVLSPIIFFVMLIICRVWMELIIVIFRIAEFTEKSANK